MPFSLFDTVVIVDSTDLTTSVAAILIVNENASDPSARVNKHELTYSSGYQKSIL